MTVDLRQDVTPGTGRFPGQDHLGKFLYKNWETGVYPLKLLTVNEYTQATWCETLYKSKVAELILYGRALGLSHAESEDVVQETFVHLMQRRDPPEKPDHYCVRSFRNRALNYRRSLWRRLTREWESKRWFERASEETGLERQAMLALANLPREQREVIVLKIWHQYTFEEIGELLDLSPNTAAGRYRYGMQKLKTSLQGADYERNERIGDTVAFVGAAPPLGET